MSVGRICTRVVITASPRESILEVARRMETHNVGAIVVVGASVEPVGIVTDRDITLRCVAGQLDPATTPASVIMTRGARSVDDATPIEEAVRTMAGVGSRSLVVTGAGGKVVGLLSVDDVIRAMGEQSDAIGHLLQKEAPICRCSDSRGARSGSRVSCP